MEQQTPSEVDWKRTTKKNDIPIIPTTSKPDDEIYKRHKRRGTAIIFNHKHFDVDECSTRVGTDKDSNDLKLLLTELKFDVVTHDDLTYDQIIEVLQVVSKMNHTDSDCLLIVVMSHGENGKLYARDQKYPSKKLWFFFSPILCPSLAGKPKLFFIQACRGDTTDPGVILHYDETDSKQQDTIYSIPVTADFLIMYATVEGYYAWRDPLKGSYFIQSLVRQLRKHHERKDLLSILTCVNREVAIDFTSFEPDSPAFDKKKEMCSIVSMLTRLFYLH